MLDGRVRGDGQFRQLTGAFEREFQELLRRDRLINQVYRRRSRDGEVFACSCQTLGGTKAEHVAEELETALRYRHSEQNLRQTEAALPLPCPSLVGGRRDNQ